MPNSLSTSEEIDKFKRFLTERGAEVLSPTNGYEVIRFRSGDTTSIIYRRSTGRLTMTGEANTAYSACRSGTSWRAIPATKRSNYKKVNTRLKAIRKRDGDLCFYCMKPVSTEDGSEEHLVNATFGGPNHISNLFLAHKTCNHDAGTLSAPEKIKIHDDAVRQMIYDEQESERSVSA